MCNSSSYITIGFGADVTQSQPTEISIQRLVTQRLAQNPADQKFVFFSVERSVGVKTIRKLVSPTTKPYCNLGKLLGILEEKSIRSDIIVFPGNVTLSAPRCATRPKQPTHSLI